MNSAPVTANATFSATLCDQLWADGLRAAFIAPGSRSTPLALALTAQPGISVHVFHDERAAAFAALGHGLATGTPALVLCSSGTAGAHFYAAVIEADASAVPLIVVTADRPPELWGRGAPQTIDQTHLFGSRVRRFVEPGPPDELDPSCWRAVARDLWLGATGAMPGPVHLNMSFRDPLTGTPGELPEPLAAVDPRPVGSPDSELVDQIVQAVSTERGAIVAGRTQVSPSEIVNLAAMLGWPLLADHRSGCRMADSPNVVRHFDSLLRHPAFADAHRPDVILRIGEIVSSKSTSQWLSACGLAGATVISGRPHGRHIDPETIATIQFDEPNYVHLLGSRVDSNPDSTWLNAWQTADQLAITAIANVVGNAEQPTEIGIAQAAIDAVPADGTLVVASSMPVRDVEWFGQNRSDITVIANRGANGIDGIVSTAIGCALSGQPTVCLIGDVAFLHDTTSLIALQDRPIDLSVVVTNNDGGGIFSFLPQHELLSESEYEALFGTPHGTDLAAVAAAHGLAVEEYSASSLAPRGIRIVIARTSRKKNLHLHDQAHAAVATALGE